jgi:hypothetical protein
MKVSFHAGVRLLIADQSNSDASIVASPQGVRDR